MLSAGLKGEGGRERKRKMAASEQPDMTAGDKSPPLTREETWVARVDECTGTKNEASKRVRALAEALEAAAVATAGATEVHASAAGLVLEAAREAGEATTKMLEATEALEDALQNVQDVAAMVSAADLTDSSPSVDRNALRVLWCTTSPLLIEREKASDAKHENKKILPIADSFAGEESSARAHEP